MSRIPHTFYYFTVERHEEDTTVLLLESLGYKLVDGLYGGFGVVVISSHPNEFKLKEYQTFLNEDQLKGRYVKLQRIGLQDIRNALAERENLSAGRVSNGTYGNGIGYTPSGPSLRAKPRDRVSHVVVDDISELPTSDKVETFKKILMSEEDDEFGLNKLHKKNKTDKVTVMMDSVIEISIESNEKKGPHKIQLL